MKAREKPGSGTVDYLFKKFVGTNPRLLAIYEDERTKLEIARKACDLRETAGLSRAQLAKKIRVTAKAIRDLEDADYNGDAFALLHRIAGAVKRRVEIRILPLKTKSRHAAKTPPA